MNNLSSNTGKVVPLKGISILEIKLEGLGSDAWNASKTAIALVVMESLQTTTLPSGYKKLLVSELYKKIVKSPCTFIENGSRTILWTQVNLKWLIGYPSIRDTELPFKLKTSHVLPALNKDTVQVLSFSLINEASLYSNSDLPSLLEEGFIILDPQSSKIKCSKQSDQINKIFKMQPTDHSLNVLSKIHWKVKSFLVDSTTDTPVYKNNYVHRDLNGDSHSVKNKPIITPSYIKGKSINNKLIPNSNTHELVLKEQLS